MNITTINILGHSVELIKVGSFVDMILVPNREITNENEAKSLAMNVVCYLYNEGIKAPGIVRFIEIRDSLGNLILKT